MPDEGHRTEEVGPSVSAPPSRYASTRVAIAARPATRRLRQRRGAHHLPSARYVPARRLRSSPHHHGGVSTSLGRAPTCRARSGPAAHVGHVPSAPPGHSQCPFRARDSISRRHPAERTAHQGCRDGSQACVTRADALFPLSCRRGAASRAAPRRADGAGRTATHEGPRPSAERVTVLPSSAQGQGPDALGRAGRVRHADVEWWHDPRGRGTAGGRRLAGRGRRAGPHRDRDAGPGPACGNGA